MNRDEDEIRQLIDLWMAATKAGDVDAVLDLMADDVVFLLPGQQSMTKAEFAEAARAMAGAQAPRIDGRSEIQELQVLGDWAFVRNRLTVIMTPPGGQPLTRAGFTLTLFRKENGRWRLARDANLLSPVGG